MSLKNKYEVIIVGYGPLGQLCGILLSKLGIKCALIEPYKDINPSPQASAVDSQSLRFLDALGVYEDLKELFNTPEFLDYVLPDGKIIQRSVVKDTSDGYPIISTFFQPKLENALREKVAESEFVDLFLSHELISFSETKHNVLIKCKDLNKNKLIKIESSFLLACDGINSSVRKKLKILSEDLKYNKEWLIVDISDNKKKSENNTIRQVCDFERPTSYTYLSDYIRRWEFQLLPGENRDDMLQEDKIASLLDKYIDGNDYSISRKDIYKFRAECAEEWRKGRIVLLGSAAYQLPPFGYQSLNSEIRDINNFCWKLKLVLRSNCNIEILDSYKSEREKVAKETISSSLAMGQLIDSIAVSFKKNIPLEESVPPEARIQAFKDVTKDLNFDENKIFFNSQLTLAFKSLVSNSFMSINGKKQLIDQILGLNFCIFVNEDSKSNISEDMLQFYEEIDAKVFDTQAIEFEDIAMSEGLKNYSFIIRPDKKIFGVSDHENSLEKLTDHLKMKIFYNK